MEAYKVGDIIRWNVDRADTGKSTYGKVLDIINNLILLTFLDLEKPPDKATNWDEGKLITHSWITNKNGYAPLDKIYKLSKLFCSNNNLCNCTIDQIMIQGCSCGGV